MGLRADRRLERSTSARCGRSSRLITRGPDPEDRRGTLIALTPAGRRLVDDVSEAHLANERRLLSGLTEAEQRRLADLLRKLQLGLPPG